MPRRVWTSHRWLTVAGVLLVLLASGAWLLHSSFVRRHVLTWAIARARTSAGIEATVGRLDYNLFTLRVSLETVTLTRGGAETPFAAFDKVRIDLPWTILRGRRAIQALEVERPRITVTRGEDGTLNLPDVGSADAAEPPPESAPVEIGTLTIRDLSLTYDDRPLNLSVEGRGVGLTMAAAGAAGIAGRLVARDGVRVRLGDRETVISRLDGRLTFDGRALGFDAVTVSAPEAEVRLDGRVDLVAAVPRIDARFDGTATLGALAPWVVTDSQVSGTARASGTIEGPLGSPRMSLVLSGANLTWAGQPASLDARAVLSADAATVEMLRVALAGGEIAGDARIAFAEGQLSRARLEWTALDVGALARAFELDRPVRVGAVSKGGLTAEWMGTDFMTGVGRLQSTLTPNGREPRSVPLGGTLVASLDRGRWQAGLRQFRIGAGLVAIEASGRLDPDDLTATTLDGRFEAETGDLGGLLARLRQAGLPLPSDAAGTLDTLDGAVAVRGALSGSLAAPRLGGSLTATGLELARLGPGTLDASFAADRSLVRFDSWMLAIGPNTLTGDLSVDLDARTLDGTLTAVVPRVSLFAGALPPRWRPEGSVRLEATLGGTLDSPSADARLSAGTIDVAGQRVGPLDASLRLVDRTVVVERFDLAQGPGRLGLTGRYALDSGRYTVAATGRGLAVRRITPVAIPLPGDPVETADAGKPAVIPVEAVFDLDLDGEGTLDAPRAHGSLRVSELAWGAYDVGGAQLDLEFADGRVRLTAGVPALEAAIEATAALQAPRRFTATATIGNAELSTLLRPSGRSGRERPASTALDQPIPFGGAVSLRATAAGDLDALADATADLDLRLVNATVGTTPIQLDRPARLRYNAGAIVADDLELRIGETTLSAVGRFGAAASDREGLSVSLTGSLADLVPLARLAPGLADLQAAGRVEVGVRAFGLLDAPSITGSVSVAGASAGLGELPPLANIDLRARLEAGLLTLDELRASWQGATLRATGTAPVTLAGNALPEAYRRTLPALPDRARFQVVTGAIPPGVLAPFVEADTLAQLAGSLVATAQIEATSLDLAGLRADVTFDRAELITAGVRLAQLRPTRLSLADGRLEFVDWSWGGSGSGAGNLVNVRGQVRLGGDTPELDALVDGSLDLRMLGAVFRDIATRGRATFDIRATGPVGEPTIDGRFALQQGEVAIRDPRIAVTSLTGTAALTADRLEFQDVRANVNGGTMQASGWVEHRGFTLSDGSIRFIGRRLAVELPEHLRSEVDLDLTLAVSDMPVLTGRVTVLRGSYRAPISLAGQLLSQVEVRSAVPAEPGALDGVRLSVDVVSSEGILVDNNYGRLEIDSDLEVTGTPAQPALAGRLTIGEGGAVFLAGQSWSIERGTVDFTSATRIEPDFDLAFVTRIQQYDVRLSVRGTPDALDATLTAPDGLGQADAVSLLLTGRQASDTTAAQLDIARGQLVMLLSGEELLGFAGRAVGLDTAQVSRGLGGAASDFDLLATDTDPSARLTISKQLRRDVEVIVSQSLRDVNDLTWIANYRPLRSLELRTMSRGDGDRSYEFRHELNFPGAARARQGARGDPRAAARIAAVRIQGEPGFDQRELRRRLRLAEGDRFDFYRWQQDRDRLARFYHDRGYLEARIQATREADEGPDGRAGTTLVYTVERGPATVLDIQGARLPGEVLGQMRDTWARAVFDGFLLEDLAELARRSLVAHGYVLAEARAAVDETVVDPKRILVRLSPGERYDEQRIEFRGQAQQTAAELDEVLRAGGLRPTVWLRPADVEGALVAHYRRRGHLSATVAIEEPSFSGRSATRVVRIVEGPQAQVVRVDVVGAQARPEAEVRRTFAITPGARYEPAELEPARREVELGYFRRGYNDARVSLVGLVDPDRAEVSLTLTIDEGRQQVLESVDVRGAGVTTRGTVDAALGLTVGMPAELSATVRAQKRLYDTGVFRRAEVELEPAPGDAGTGPRPVRATATLEEVPLYRLRYGLRLSDEMGPTEVGREIHPGGVLDLLRRNLFGRAISAGIAGQAEADRRLARGILSMPRLFGLPVTSSVFLMRSRDDLPPIQGVPVIEDASDYTIEQRFRPRPSMAVSYNYRFTRKHVFMTQRKSALDLDERYNVARLTGTFAWDTRDDPLDTQRGWFHSSGLEYAPAALGSDLRFVKYVLQQFYFRTLGRDVVLASAFRLGAARGFEQDLIPSEQFYVGGSTTVRGFGEGRVAGSDYFGDEIGGNGSLTLNQEVRFPLFRWVRGVGFLDAGNVFARAGDLTFRPLEVGAGAGLRLMTPLGAVRADFGVPLTSRGREPSGRWYFSIGQTF